ncbi:MAG TPA: hypothetical protein VNB87_04950 [Propionibacteriaceae bacterium]|nr:hypothetical protein [Propionibacteriaceae bacterium]
MSLLVTGVGALVLFYCWRYFRDDEPGLGKFAATLTGFAGAIGFRRSHRFGGGRRPNPAVRVMGPHHDLLVPAHRPRHDSNETPTHCRLCSASRCLASWAR